MWCLRNKKSTIKQRSHKRYSEYCGLSTDDKATIKAKNGDEFYEIDTSKIYKYNETNDEWVVQS